MSRQGVAPEPVLIPRTASEEELFRDVMSAKPTYPPGYRGDDFDFAALLAAWPESLPTVAEDIGVSAVALKRFLDGSSAALQTEEITRLRKLLHVERDHTGGDYSDAVGPYLFLPSTPKTAEDSYMAATNGDLKFCAEFVPSKKSAVKEAHKRRDPHIIGFQAWRSDFSIVLIQRHGEYVSDTWRDSFFNIGSVEFQVGCRA
ncbi:hypothetical protein [Pseudoxanthomonas kaohsiungensis]|uniref:Uncharacterized protein n=1 Tax=Pseudoxanthomonas kaohsiungensis TaxID=283923 RepID=A0ABW3LYB2_9GAMM|nr:hypothetical protein [Pseudoxanthomonas kaohsiungensis]